MRRTLAVVVLVGFLIASAIYLFIYYALIAFYGVVIGYLPDTALGETVLTYGFIVIAFGGLLQIPLMIGSVFVDALMYGSRLYRKLDTIGF